MLDRAQQHAARAAGGVVDRLALLRVEDLDHHAHDAARRVELARLVAAGDVGELADQVLVGIAENVGADRLVAEGIAEKPSMRSLSSSSVNFSLLPQSAVPKTR